MAEFFSMQRSKFPYTVLLNILSFLSLISCLKADLHSLNFEILWGDSNPIANYYKKMDSDVGCKGIQMSQNKQEKCSYVKSNEGCKPRGYIPYLQLFYCTFGPVLGYFSLALWLVLLFYLLGDTASNYFCYSIVGLSKTLKITCSMDHDEGPNLSDEVEPQTADQNGRVTMCVNIILCILELRLELPRRLTIRVVSEDRWSKPVAVVSVTLTPTALALTWNSNCTKSSLLKSKISGSVGIASGILAFCTTERFNPPRKCSLHWLAGGFIMSITWTYILAQEFISLLMSLGVILGIDHSTLGLTVLAWEGSVGDMVANVTMSMKCGPQGAQLTMSGSYAGTIFNTVVALGLSLALSAWTTYPATYAISVNHSGNVCCCFSKTFSFSLHSFNFMS